MKIYTSYYANWRKFPENSHKISISLYIMDIFKKLVDEQDISLAPTQSILKEYKKNPDEIKYVNRLKKEILDKVDWNKKIEDWKKLNKDIILLCYEKSTDFCHRHIVAEKLKEFNIDIEEIGFENKKCIDYKYGNENNNKEKTKISNNENIINSFKNEYSFLSNMAKVDITYDNITYPSVEHFYVAMKVKKEDTITIENKKLPIRKYIPTIKSPGEVKKFGRTLTLREDWEDIKLEVMEKGLKQKFYNSYYKQKLLDTKDIKLVEGNYWNDTFWGVCNGIGENHLGKLLMKIRKELKENIQSKNKGINQKNITKDKNKFYLTITGHTNIEKANNQKYKDGYNKEIYKKVYNEIKEMIKTVCQKYNINRKELVLVSGMARGVDEIFAEYAVKNRLKLILAIPGSIKWHKNRQSRIDYQTKEEIMAQAIEYDKYLQYAGKENIYEIKKDYKNGNYKYVNFARNDFMMDIADGVISYLTYNSTGTLHGIKGAKKVNKYLGNIIDYDKNIKTIEKTINKKIKKIDKFKIHNNVDLFKEKTNVIIQGCNCFNTMGAGVAKIIKEQYPEAFKADLRTTKGDRVKMGNFTYAKIDNGNTNYVVNLYTQYTFYDKNDMFDIKAFHKGMEKVIDFFIDKRKEAKKENIVIDFSLPAIGLGLANGKPEEIYKVLKKLGKKYEYDNININLCLIDKKLIDIFNKLDKQKLNKITNNEIKR